jgi:O-antigen ligase/tetratricopeptide (TPR) repeat protein
MKVAARWTILISLFTLPFLALYVPNGMFFPFITGKNFAFRILVEIAFCSWVALAFLDRKYRPQFSWTFLIYGLFALWMLIADFLAVNAHKALWSNFERMDGWVTLIHVFAFFVVAGSVFSVDKLWRKWWMTFVGSSVIVSFYGFLQLAGKADIHQSGTRVDASLGNAEYLAGYLLFTIAMSLWLAVGTAKNIYLKSALYVVVVLELVILFATGTRGTLIALVGAAGIGAVLWLLRGSKRGRAGAVAVLAAAILLVGGLFALRTSSVVTENPNLARLASVFSLKQELGTRISIWTMAIDGAKEKPLHGWGQEGYNYVFNQYYIPSLYGQEPWFDRAHNLFLDWLVAGGVPALILFILLLGSGYAAFFRNSEYTITQRTIIICAFIAYTIQGLVVFDNLLTYIPLAALLAMAHGVRTRPIGFIQNAPEGESMSAHTSIGTVALVGAIVLIWMVNVPTINAGGDLIAAITPGQTPEAQIVNFKQAFADNGFASQEINEQLVQFAAGVAAKTDVSDQVKNEVGQYAIEQLAAEVARSPQDARLRLQYAVLLRGYGQLAEASKESAFARTLSPTKQSIIFEQGVEALQSSDYKSATAYFQQAYDLDTHFDDAAAYLAAGHIFEGKVNLGKSVLQDHFGTTTVNQNILIVAYYQTHDWADLIATLQLKLSQQNDASTGFQVAAAYAAAGNIPAALAQVQATVAAHPDSAAQGQALTKQLKGLK